MDGYELNGLFDEAHCEPPLMDLALFVGDVVATHNRNSADSRWPPQLVELLTYDGDETYCFDTSEGLVNGEYPVVVTGPRPAEGFERYAATFLEFLQREAK